MFELTAQILLSAFAFVGMLAAIAMVLFGLAVFANFLLWLFNR